MWFVWGSLDERQRFQCFKDKINFVGRNIFPVTCQQVDGSIGTMHRQTVYQNQRMNCAATEGTSSPTNVCRSVGKSSNDERTRAATAETVQNRTLWASGVSYFGEENMNALDSNERIDDVCIATGRQKHNDKVPGSPKGRPPKDLTAPVTRGSPVRWPSFNTLRFLITRISVG